MTAEEYKRAIVGRMYAMINHRLDQRIKEIEQTQLSERTKQLIIDNLHDKEIRKILMEVLHEMLR